MNQIDMFEEMKLKIYESPDGGKTIYEREFGNTERTLVKTAIQQQWKIVYNGNVAAFSETLSLI